MDNQSAIKWIKRVGFFLKEYPFGPVKELRNEEGRLHNEDGDFAFISPYRCTQYENGKRNGVDVDKWGSIQYYFRGVLVPPKYILDSKAITFEEIMAEKNTEVRRIGMIIYGFPRMIEEGKFEVLHEDEEIKAELYKHTNGKDEEPTVIVRVTDGTPKYNGEYERYILQVPPDMKTCREAIAWTFRLKPEEYSPEIET